MVTTSSRLPPYVARLGEQVFAPPFDMREANLHIVILRADQACLNELIDEELNTPWRSAFERRGVLHRFRAACPWVLLVFNDVEHLSPAGINVFARQQELIVMVPIEDQGPSRIPRTEGSNLWYVPLVFNNLPPAILAGRELYGYPKQYCEFRLKRRPLNKLVRPFIPRNRRDRKPIFGTNKVPWRQLTMYCYGRVGLKGDESTWALELVPILTLQTRAAPALGSKPPVDAVGRVAPELRRPLATTSSQLDWIPTDRSAIDATGDWVDGSPPSPNGYGAPPSGRPLTDDMIITAVRKRLQMPVAYLFLRQFRDPGTPQKASYQAVVNGEVVARIGDEDRAWSTGLKNAESLQVVLSGSTPSPPTADGDEGVPPIGADPGDASLQFRRVLGSVHTDPVKVLRAENMTLTVNQATTLWARP